jgi:N-sulfoglucosamine sulfohydrolase
MPEEELYDLAEDPHEIHNLATSGQAVNQVALKKLRAAVERWIRQTGDRGAVKERKAPARRPK